MREAGNRGKPHLSYWGDASWRTHIFYALQSAPGNTRHSIISILGANSLKKNRVWSVNPPHQTWWGAGSLDWPGNLGSSARFRSLESWCRSPAEAHKNWSHKWTRCLQWRHLCDHAPELFSPSAPAAEAGAFLSSPAAFLPPSHSLTSFLLSRRRESENSTTYSTICKNNVTLKDFWAHPKPKN